MLLYKVLVGIKKTHAKIINLKCLIQRGTKNLSYLTDHILHQTFIIFKVSQ